MRHPGTRATFYDRLFAIDFGYCHDHLYHKAFDYDSAIVQINRNLVDFFQQSPAIANRIKEDPGSGKLRNGIATTSYFRVDVAGVEFER